MWNPPDPDFFQAVWLIARQIPAGKVSSYGQIASMIPPYQGTDPDQHKRLVPRWVGTALRRIPDGSVPWQRVINSQGKISLSGTNGDRQRQLLEAEGIVFDASGRVDFDVCGWQGPDDAWLEEHNLLPPDLLGGAPRQASLF